MLFIAKKSTLYYNANELQGRVIIFILSYCCPACAAEDIPALILSTFLSTLILVPFFYLSYLLVEYFQSKHKEKFNSVIKKQDKYGPVVGGALGLIPQCGFSSTMALLYSQKVLSIGTFFAVLIATSDEAMFVLIANRDFKTLALLLSSKFILAIIFGYVIDFLFRKRNKDLVDIEDTEITEPCGCCKKSSNIFLTALKQTIKVFLFVLVFSIAINIIVYLVGEETFESFLLSGNVFQPIIACLIGLIPNCASSILLTNLYVAGSVSFASLLAGLMCNAGMAIIILFKNNKKIKENLLLLLSIFTISSVVGIIISIFTSFL
ncbi:MAG: putative manganese transporter [bacterium]